MLAAVAAPMEAAAHPAHACFTRRAWPACTAALPRTWPVGHVSWHGVLGVVGYVISSHHNDTLSGHACCKQHVVGVENVRLHSGLGREGKGGAVCAVWQSGGRAPQRAIPAQLGRQPSAMATLYSAAQLTSTSKAWIPRDLFGPAQQCCSTPDACS